MGVRGQTIIEVHRHMLPIIQKNIFYLRAYLTFFTLLFIFILTTEPLGATLFFSAHRTAVGDFFFKWITLLGEAYPFIALTLYFLFKKQRPIALKMAVVGILVLIPIGILKELFSYDRPATIIENMGFLPGFHFVRDVEILRGATSFPSGHTAGAFAVWSLLAFQFSRNKTLQLVCLLIAIIVGISRVYLAQHFPQDVLFGSVIGIATAIFIEFIIENFLTKPNYDRPHY